MTEDEILIALCTVLVMLLGAAVVAIIVYQLTMRNMRRELDDMREIISYDKMAYNSLRETCKKLQDSLDKKSNQQTE